MKIQAKCKINGKYLHISIIFCNFAAVFGYMKVTLQQKVLKNWYFENELKGYTTTTI